MKDLSLHILDIAQNSISAKASLIEISILENLTANIFQINIKDNGTGMSKETLAHAADPFFTSRTTRKVGLGLSLFRQNAERAGGYLNIESELGKGTLVSTVFQHNNIDRPVLGDIAGIVVLLASANPLIRFIYKHQKDTQEYIFDTAEVNETLEGVPINNPQVIRFLKEMINENLKEIEIL